MQESFNIDAAPNNNLASDVQVSTAQGDDNKHFSITALLVVGLVVGVVYALG